MPLEAGDKLGPYEIVSLLGQGGMGQVWKARDPRLNRVVAIKTSLVEFDARFEREARAVAQLNHPHICHIYDVGRDYLVMELVDGEPLTSVIKGGPMPAERIAELAAQMADALEEARTKGIVHRDLKPGKYSDHGQGAGEDSGLRPGQGRTSRVH